MEGKSARAGCDTAEGIQNASAWRPNA